MAKKHKLSAKAASMPVAILIGAFVCVVGALIGALIVAWLVAKETVGVGGIGAGAMLVVLLSSALGSCLAVALARERKLPVCGLTALAFYLILLSMNAVFFDGTFGKMGLVALMILAGAGGSLLPGMRGKNRKSKIKIPAYR